MLVLRLLMANGTLELGLHSALEPDMPVQRVRPRISIAATWARIAGRIANVRRNSMVPRRWGLVHTVLHSQLIRGNVEFFQAIPRARLLRIAGCRALAVLENHLVLCHHLIFRHQSQIQGLVLIVPFDRCAWRVLPFQKIDNRIRYLCTCPPRSPIRFQRFASQSRMDYIASCRTRIIDEEGWRLTQRA